MPLKAALPENRDVVLGAHRPFGEGALVEPDRNRTYRPPDESGALPLSYGPVTKDAGTMPECGLISNQENGLAIVRGLRSVGPIGFLFAHQHYAHQVRADKEKSAPRGRRFGGPDPKG
jgi:hypothetical protein